MIWIVSVTYGSATYRWASSPITWDVLDSEGLPVDFVGAWNAPDAVHADDTIPVEVVFPDGLNIAAEEVAGRILLSGADAEVALLAPGDDWSERLVVRVGVVTEPEIGCEGEPIAFSVEAMTVDTALIPSASCTVTKETFSAAPETSKGLTYPVVYGRPGPFSEVNGSAQRIGATPGIVVDFEMDGDVAKANVLLINAYAVLATTARVHYADPDAPMGFSFVDLPVLTSSDGIGQRYAKVNIAGESDKARTAGTYTISWAAGATPVDNSNDTDSAGAVLLWWLRQSTVPLDLARSQSALAYLDAYTCSGHTDASVSPEDWAADRLADYPVRLVRAPEGTIVTAVRWNATASDATAVITVDDPFEASTGGGTTGAIRLTPMRCTGKQFTTEVRVTWARSLATGNAYRLTIFSSDPDTRSRNPEANPYATGKVTKSATVRSIEVELADCWSEATAYNIARYVAWRDGEPRHVVTLAVPTATHGRLVVGDVVLFSDTTLGLSQVVCLVDSVGLTASTMTEVDLVLLRA